MAVPGFQELTLPVLREFADGRERTTREVRDAVAPKLGITGGDLAEVLPSGRQTRYANRSAWAHVYLKQAGLLESPRCLPDHGARPKRAQIAARTNRYTVLDAVPGDGGVPEPARTGRRCGVTGWSGGCSSCHRTYTG